jgi:multiple sugar transport system substrate-binding protein
MADPSVERAPSLNIWINETSPEHTQVLTNMMEDFHQQSGVDVSLQQVSPMLLPDLMQTAVLSDTLPDIVLHPLEYTMAWTEEGILDPQVTGTIIDEIGRDTFDPAALALVDTGGQPAALPSDGYQQLWLYRSDWIEEAQLDPPDTYSDMLLAAETFLDRENFISGLVIPTESNLINTHRAFEHLAIANGCRLINEQGEVLLLEEACREALDFYYSIVNQFSPIGVQTDTSARNAFLEGRTAIIMSSPSILPDLVETGRLDQNTGILTDLAGSGNEATPANFGNISYLGITRSADPQAASAFARYWFTEGYPDWLAIASERKVPMRLGTAGQPRQFIDSWGQAPISGDESLLDLFGAETASQLREGIATTPRWGFREGQGAIVGELYKKLTFSVVLQEMLSGYFNTEKTIQEAYNRVIDLIPNYAFLPTPTPEPTPEDDS